MTDSYTEDLSRFGSRELEILEKLLKARRENGLPESFHNDGVKPAMNADSGNVFLVNSEYQVAMMNGDKLELFISTPYEGIEGFLVDITEEKSPNDLYADDIQYIQDVAKAEGFELPKTWVEWEK